MSSIILKDVSKFYGDILGVNRVTLSLETGITGLVGPNGAGKSTLMNLAAGLMRPDRGSIEIMGFTSSQPEDFYRILGYCTQYDSFPIAVTGYQFLQRTLEIHGYSKSTAKQLAQLALQQVDLVSAADQSVETYSKGMRQRIKLAQSFCHQPEVLILDEPLNGLDPIARAQMISLFREFADQGMTIVISSHILHEVDLISDRIVLLNNGYLIAEGDVAGIAGETGEPMKIYIRSVSAAEIASRVFNLDHVLEAQLHHDGAGLFVRTKDADAFFLAFNAQVLAERWVIDAIGPADETVEAVYRHLIVQEQVAP